MGLTALLWCRLLMLSFAGLSASSYKVTSLTNKESQYGYLPEEYTCNTKFNVTGNRTDCFQGKCFCTTYFANCSGNFEKLTSIPKLPPSIKFLNFSNNNVVNLTKDFFRNVPNLVTLALSNCSIAHIHPEAFSPLKQLRVLYLDRNMNLTDVTLVPVFQKKSLQCVDIRYGVLTTLPEVLFRKDAMPNLQELFLHANKIEVANLTSFQNLPHLRTLAWGLNDMYSLYTDVLLELDYFDVYSNRLVDFPETCKEYGNTSLFPKLQSLNLSKNKITTLPSKMCLPILQYIDLSGNYFPILYSHMFRPQLFPKLKFLHLEYIGTRIEKIEKNAFSNPTLRMISLMYNDIDFSLNAQYSDDSFKGCPNLSALQISRNFFTEVSDQRFLRLTGHLTNLEALYIGAAGIQQISTKTFANFLKLTKLQLYQNKISEIPDGAFDNNPLLSDLELNENRITTISESTFDKNLLQIFTVLDLSGNPFTCDCNLRWFADWFRNNKTTFSHARVTYNCSNLNQLPVESFDMIDQPCMLSASASRIIISVFSILILLFMGVCFLFRFQWVLRLKLYEVFRGSSEVRLRIIQAGNFDFDVFVCYSSADKTWVVENLLPELEGRLKLKLCIHERDFILGKHIVDNIVECVEHSKKILLVFSKHFLLSSWCQFELAVCLQHVIDCDDSLMTVCLDDVAARELTSPMRAVMSMMTYIQWESSNSYFWERVEKALEDIISCSCTNVSQETVINL